MRIVRADLVNQAKANGIRVKNQVFWTRTYSESIAHSIAHFGFTLLIHWFRS